jgi:RNA polymerase sigma factor (sigma-70 family)
MEGDIMSRARRPRLEPQREILPPLTPPQEQLFQANWGLVYVLVNCYRQARRWLNIEDLEQEGMLGLLKAVHAFDPRRGRFSTFAGVCIRRRLDLYIRLETRQLHASLQPYPADDDERQHGGDVVDPRSARPQECREAADLARWLLSQVRDVDRRLLTAYHLDGVPTRQLAAQLGISKTGVTEKLRRARRYARGAAW